jgi:phosphohistidine phosphatase SixA
MLGALVFQMSLLTGNQCPALDNALARLRKGGLVIVMRHAEATSSGCDPCERNHPSALTQLGRDQVDRIGVIIRELKIPIAKVQAGSVCRTFETATRIFAKPPVVEKRLELCNRDRKFINAAIRTIPPTQGNTFLITHGTVMNEITIQGVQAVKGYDGGGAYSAVFDPARPDSPLLGCLTAQQWEELRPRAAASMSGSGLPNLAVAKTTPAVPHPEPVPLRSVSAKDGFKLRLVSSVLQKQGPFR